MHTINQQHNEHTRGAIDTSGIQYKTYSHWQHSLTHTQCRITGGHNIHWPKYQHTQCRATGG